MAKRKEQFKTDAASILENLKIIAPNICFRVNWEVDDSFVWDGDGPDPVDDGFVAHDVTVSACAIISGILAHGDDHLGGAYDKPDQCDTDVHGYLPQMLLAAAGELARQVDGELLRQCDAADEYLKKVMRVRYHEQRAAHGNRKS